MSYNSISLFLTDAAQSYLLTAVISQLPLHDVLIGGVFPPI